MSWGERIQLPAACQEKSGTPEWVDEVQTVVASSIRTIEQVEGSLLVNQRPMPPTPAPSSLAERLARANDLVRSAWEDAAASPFLGQLHLDEASAQVVRTTLRTALGRHVPRCTRTFEAAPYAAAWCVLHALARSYGAGTREVYLHIGSELDVELEAATERQAFKSAFLGACRAIGLRVLDPSHPTGLFFGNVGVADAQADHLAEAMLMGAVRVGAPPEEDLAELRAWQREVLRDRFKAFPRAEAALQQDMTASYARLFCDWRVGEAPLNPSAKVLFDGLGAAARRQGIDAKGLSAAPVLIWTRGGFALLPSESSRSQFVEADAFPTKLSPGRPWRVPSPWPASVLWRSGPYREAIRVAPDLSEILVFATDTQRLVGGRQNDRGGRVAVPSRELLIVAGSPFDLHDASGTRQSADQGQVHIEVAHVGSEGAFISTAQGTLRLELESDPVIRMQGPVIGRAGSLPLYASGARLILVSGKGFAETRVVRLRCGGRTCYVNDIRFDEDGRAELPLASFELDRPGDPCEAEVALLVAGAGPGPGARVDLTARFHVWPGTAEFDASKPFRVDRAPGNLLAATSEHVLQDGGGLSIDGSAGFAHATLSLQIGGRPRNFAIPVRGTRVIRNATSERTREPVSLGSILLFGHAQRHDTLTVHCTDRSVDLDVRGTRVRRPFMARSEWEIPASQLRPEAPQGDEIALIRDDGSRQILARIAETLAARDVVLRVSDAEAVFVVELGATYDVIGLEVHKENSSCAPERVLASLRDRPLDRPTPGWFRAEMKRIDPPLVEVRVDRRAWRLEPGIGLILVQRPGDPLPSLLEDDAGRPHAVPLIAADAPPPGRRDARLVAHGLARILAGSYEDRCDEQVRQAFEPRATTLVRQVAETGFTTPLLPLAFPQPLVPGKATLPRFNLLHPGLAPEVFGGDPSAFSAFGNIPAAGRLAAMANALSMVIPPALFEKDDEENVLKRWLAEVHAPRDECPEALAGDALRQAFLSFRQNARGSDFGFTMARVPIGRTLGRVFDAYSSVDQDLLDFDETAGPDRTGVNLAAYLARFARACRARRVREFHDLVAKRTGLPVEQITPATTLALHVGCELFAYFLIFWTLHARAQARP